MDLTYTVCKTRGFDTLDEMKKALMSKARNTDRREMARKVFSAVLREHRHDLFGTFSGFNIITNGYGEIKCVEIHDTGKRYSFATIMKSLEKLQGD